MIYAYMTWRARCQSSRASEIGKKFVKQAGKRAAARRHRLTIISIDGRFPISKNRSNYDSTAYFIFLAPPVDIFTSRQTWDEDKIYTSRAYLAYHYERRRHTAWALRLSMAFIYARLIDERIFIYSGAAILFITSYILLTT